MHPLFVMLFMEPDPDGELTGEADQGRRARLVSRARSAQLIKTAAGRRDLPRRP